MFCKNCGKENIDNSKFCSKCGNNILEIKQVNKQPKSSNLIRTIMIGFIVGVFFGIGSCSEIAGLSQDAPIVLMFGFVIGVLGAIVGAIIGKK